MSCPRLFWNCRSTLSVCFSRSMKRAASDVEPSLGQQVVQDFYRVCSGATYLWKLHASFLGDDGKKTLAENVAAETWEKSGQPS